MITALTIASITLALLLGAAVGGTLSERAPQANLVRVPARRRIARR